MGIKHILVSLSADIASSLITAKYAIYTAKLFQAKLTAVYVVDEKALQELVKTRIFLNVEAMEYEREMEEQGKRFLARFKHMAESKQVPFEGVQVRGVVHTEVVNLIKKTQADLLIMGELKGALSIKEAFYDEGIMIFYGAGCPVLVVKNPEYVESLYKSL